jgi:hypothetical protein
MWKEEGKGKGMIFFKFCFFIVEWLGTGGQISEFGLRFKV